MEHAEAESEEEEITEDISHRVSQRTEMHVRRWVAGLRPARRAAHRLADFGVIVRVIASVLCGLCAK
jgi:hypothetical protein